MTSAVAAMTPAAKKYVLRGRNELHRIFERQELLNKDFARNLLSWKHSGFSIDNSVRILDESAQENLAEYIARPPISLAKIRYEPFKGRVLFHTTYSKYFRENLHMFDALDFIAELTQHIPPKGLQLIRRYGLHKRAVGTYALGFRTGS